MIPGFLSEVVGGEGTRSEGGRLESRSSVTPHPGSKQGLEGQPPHPQLLEPLLGYEGVHVGKVASELRLYTGVRLVTQAGV